VRYTNFKGFEKHLAASAPHQLCHVYLIHSADEFERKQSIDSVLHYVLAPNGLSARYFGSDATVSSVMEAIDTPVLFSSQCVVVVDDVDKKFLEELSGHFKEPRSFGYLILGSKQKANARFIEMHGVVLDLMDEKPWEKEKRWTEQLHEKARAAGKRLAPDAALWMIERLERDAAVLSSEMDKLLCFCAHKSTIDRIDVEQICSATRTHTLWQIADDLVWNKIFRAESADLRDASFFYGLLASLRQQLMVGIKMHDLSRRKVPFSEWTSFFPKIWPKTIEKKAHSAQRLGYEYFRGGLDRLFDMELLAKNSAVPLDALFDFFRVWVLSPKLSDPVSGSERFARPFFNLDTFGI
jgi:DNA polymerase III delta subunit